MLLCGAAVAALMLLTWALSLVLRDEEYMRRTSAFWPCPPRAA
jgi:hypothetical protein